MTRVSLVSGANRGIGYAIARELDKHGIRVRPLMPGIVAADMTMAHKGDGSGVPTQAAIGPTMAQIAAMVLELPNNKYFRELGVANRLETGGA